MPATKNFVEEFAIEKMDVQASHLLVNPGWVTCGGIGEPPPAIVWTRAGMTLLVHGTSGWPALWQRPIPVDGIMGPPSAADQLLRNAGATWIEMANVSSNAWRLSSKTVIESKTFAVQKQAKNKKERKENQGGALR